MNIRPLKQSERLEWESLFDQYAGFYKTTVPEGGHENVWQWIFDPDNSFWCDLAVDENDSPFGFTQYQLMHRSLGGSMVCYLSDLYVNSENRGCGAGRALIDHVFAFAKANNIANVRWLTQDFNYAGRRLYDTYSPKSDFILYSNNV